MPHSMEAWPVSRQFKFSGEYFKQVADATSDCLNWTSIWLCRARETSNDVTFQNAQRNSLTLDLSGTARHLTVMEGKTDETPTGVGDICQIPKGLSARFAWETIGPEQSSIMVEFGDDIFATHCPEIVSGHFLLGHFMPQNYAARPELASLVRILARELDETHRRGRLFAESVVRLLAIEIAESAWTRKPCSIHPGAFADRRIRKAIDFIEANFAKDISLRELNAETGLNSTRLIGLFKRATGSTPYAYVIRRRIQEATHLLRMHWAPICDIALEAGFSDQQQMTHAFRKHLGRTPKSFRTPGGP
jgi:AraC family transcriptional regulator